MHKYGGSLLAQASNEASLWYLALNMSDKMKRHLLFYI